MRWAAGCAVIWLAVLAFAAPISSAAEPDRGRTLHVAAYDAAPYAARDANGCSGCQRRPLAPGRRRPALELRPDPGRFDGGRARRRRGRAVRRGDRRHHHHAGPPRPGRVQLSVAPLGCRGGNGAAQRPGCHTGPLRRRREPSRRADRADARAAVRDRGADLAVRAARAQGAGERDLDRHRVRGAVLGGRDHDDRRLRRQDAAHAFRPGGRGGVDAGQPGADLAALHPAWSRN